MAFDKKEYRDQYSEYVEQQMSTIFSFEDWIAQTHPEVNLSDLNGER